MVLQGVLLTILLLLIFNKGRVVIRHLKKHGKIYALVAAIAALVGSLGFSEGYAYAPCKLCWIQRIFHYPQVILFAVALYLKDNKVWLYSLWLSGIGALVAGYQVLIQFNPSFAESSVCSIVPAAESCSDILIQAYGYISIPVMSLTLFVALITLGIIQYKKIS